jgi:adenylate cyclase
MEVTILFSDIRGFTAFSERADPQVIVELLNEYLATMCSIIVKHHGHVNKFIGDGILAVFSDEDEDSKAGDHSVRAVRCGAEMTEAPGTFVTGVGIHTGSVTVGNVGSSDKMEYTVIGDTVNVASRLESLNKEFGTKLILSEATHQRLGGAIETTLLGEVPVRGKAIPIAVYSVAARPR